jgi:hypothetical protein
VQEKERIHLQDNTGKLNDDINSIKEINQIAITSGAPNPGNGQGFVPSTIAVTHP